MARRAGVLTVATAAAVLSVAGPAAADVTVSPASAPQGSGENLTFHVTNDGSTPITEVTLRIPGDTPIAEVYPLSVDDWAPRIEWRKLSRPVAQIHGATPVDEVPSAVTWIAMNGTSIAPGRSADLTVAVGPLPSLSSVSFALEAKHADGSAAPSMPAAALTLTPSDSAAAPNHHGGAAGTGQAPGLSPAEEAAYDAILAGDKGPSVLSIGGWVVAALALIGAGWAFLRNRHRAPEPAPSPAPSPSSPSGEPEPQDNGPEATAAENGGAAGDGVAAGDDKEPVAAGTSKWAFKG
ncbi:DUF1775 domain-containing protein [Actinoplanes sp. DH11]|uniref:DUF1775 domain-containing protein n=1 Tax=Actinoplanes sp. DH11 TaxID=2857011 RepID=UPI001E384604|nr:DUF1775 domain-containing protein [Actinoplanes sp. DH11]